MARSSSFKSSNATASPTLFRDKQISRLTIFYNRLFPSPTILVAYGIEETAKLESVVNVLQTQSIDHAVVKCRECLSQRHLLVKMFAACVRATAQEDRIESYDRVDSINALVTNLIKLFEHRSRQQQSANDETTDQDRDEGTSRGNDQDEDGKFVLVVDGIDEQRGPSGTLLPALARLGDSIKDFSVILTSSSMRSLLLQKSGVPYIHFPSYDRTEIIQLLLLSKPTLLPDPLPPSCPENLDEERVSNIYAQFVTTVYDALFAQVSTSPSVFRRLCERLWPRFLWPLVSGESPPGKRANSSWDFARLLTRGRTLFQAEGEEALQERLLSSSGNGKAWSFEDLMKQHETEQTLQTSNLSPQPNPASFRLRFPTATSSPPPLLKHFTTLVLLAAYLASHTPPKHDIILFSRLSSSSSSKRKYLSRSRTGGIGKPKTPTKNRSPSKKSASATPSTSHSNSTTNTPSKSVVDGYNHDDDDDRHRDPAVRVNSALAKSAATTPKKERADRSMRAIFERTSHIARPFTLERLVAILRAIHPDGLPAHKGGGADRVYVELAELERFRLVVRTGGAGHDGAGGALASTALSSSGSGLAGGGGGGGDGTGGTTGGGAAGESILEEKWKVNVGREWVANVGKVWGVGLEGWEVD